MGTAENRVILLHAMADYGATAMSTPRSQGLNGALKGIKRMRVTIHHHLKSLIVGIAACLAFPHSCSSLLDLEPGLFPSLKSAFHFHNMKALPGKALSRLGGQVTGRRITIKNIRHICA